MSEAVPEFGSAGVGATGLEDFQPLNMAEAKIVGNIRSGDFDRLGDGALPEANDPERRVRAELLRFLILGGYDGFRMHEKGISISGGYIVGTLDLEGCRIPRDIRLKDCLFEASIILRSAVIDNLFLDGSALSGIYGERLEARGGIFLRGATVTGTIHLSAARLGGSIEADGATITASEGTAIDADGLEARGGILLRGADIRGRVNVSSVRLGSDFNALGARIERPGAVVLDGDGMAVRGDFNLRGAMINGETRMLGANIGGDLDCTAATLSEPEGYSLRLNRSRIGGAFFLRNGASVRGTLDLTATEMGAIYDDQDSWPEKGDLLLNRCRYGGFIGGPVDAKSRIDWLSRQQPERWKEDFWPQPYEQLASVFGEMGHQEDARAVLIAKERLQRRARRVRAKNPAFRALLAVTDGVLAVTLRYGRQPLLALVWLALFWVMGVGVFASAEYHGALKPNSPVMLRSLEWTMCGLEQGQTRYMPTAGQVLAGRALPGQNQYTCFLSQPEASSYPLFNPLMYSLDALLPVLQIGQKEFWRPDQTKPNGNFTLNYYYFQSVIGWAFSLLAVAGFSGLVKSK